MLLGLTAILAVVIGLAAVVLGAERAIMESVSIKYTHPQEAHILYSTGDLPVKSILTKEITLAVCLTIAEAEQFAKEIGRAFAEPLQLPLTVQVGQYTLGGGGRFYAEARGEIVVAKCGLKGERDA